MILLAAAALLILSVPLTGGSLGRLAEVTIRGVWLVPVAVALQAGITRIDSGDVLGIALSTIHLLSYALCAAFVGMNWRTPGVPLMAVGGGLNLVAIAANGGVMPATESAWRSAGLPAMSNQFENSNVIADARLWWLGDVFAIPSRIPLANVFSVGDVVLVLGFAVFVHRGGSVRPRLAHCADADASGVQTLREPHVRQRRDRSQVPLGSGS